MVDTTRTSGTVDDRRRRLLAAAAGGLSMGALGVGAAGNAAAIDEDTLTIIHDTHFHGRFEDADDPEKEIARYQTLVDEIREEYPNAIYLGNGDDLAPSVLGLEFEGAHMIEAMNEMDVDAVGAGNHEFDFGVEVAEERFEESSFPWVIANLLTPDGEPVPGAERWTTVETEDHTVGVFGMGTTGFHSITDYPDDWQVLGYEEAAQDAVEALEEDCDFIVCASHAPSSAHDAIAGVDGVHAVVGSHSGVVFDEPDESENGVIAEFGDEFDHIGRLTFEVDNQALTDWERLDLYDSEAVEEAGVEPPEGTDHHTPVDVQDVERDDGIAAIADEYLADLEERLGEPVVESEVELNATFENYETETGWGNLMTDIMREVGDLDEEIAAAFQNAGGIRSDATYGPGEITGSDVMDVLPFPNEVEVYELTGAEIVSYLESEVRPMPDGFGAQPAIQVSGVSYEWRGHHDESEVYNVWVGDEPVDEEETYLVATNDYVAGNSSAFDEDSLVLQSGQFQGPFMMDYLDEHVDTIAPEPENRIIRVDEAFDETTVEGDDETFTVSIDGHDAFEDPVDGTYRLVAPTHGEVEAEAVETNGGISVTFDTSAVADLFADAGVETLSVLGEVEPNDEHYGYEDDGETMSLPVNPSYDHAKVRLSLTAADVEDPSSAAGEGTDAPDTPDGDDASDDEAPGFGPVAGAAGVTGGAYLYGKLSGGDTDDFAE
ncbi:5'-nucleotidase C-terminal domain-containing protein [Halorubrum gandharaense]